MRPCTSSGYQGGYDVLPGGAPAFGHSHDARQRRGRGVSGRMPHNFVVQHVAGHAVDEGGHGRRGPEAVAEGGALRVAAHFAGIFGHNLRRRFLAATSRQGRRV